jgi:hypothetical protein
MPWFDYYLECSSSDRSQNPYFDYNCFAEHLIIILKMQELFFNLTPDLSLYSLSKVCLAELSTPSRCPSNCLCLVWAFRASRDQTYWIE